MYVCVGEVFVDVAMTVVDLKDLKVPFIVLWHRRRILNSLFTICSTAHSNPFRSNLYRIVRS